MCTTCVMVCSYVYDDCVCLCNVCVGGSWQVMQEDIDYFMAYIESKVDIFHRLKNSHQIPEQVLRGQSVTSLSISVNLSICLSSVIQSVCLSICQSICQSVCLSVGQSVFSVSCCQSVILVSQSVSLSVCLSLCLSICLISPSVHLYFLMYFSSSL